jgi:Zn-dependent M28 family amino/carboxypeptidase
MIARAPFRATLFALFGVVVLHGCRSSGGAAVSTLGAPIVPSDPAHDIAYLASQLLAGRGAGTAGDDSAANFIARGHARAGLRAAFALPCASTPCEPTYFQFFSAPGVSGHNVAAIVPGTDSVLAREFIVVGAHFDHLSMSPVSSLDPQLGTWIRPGADDNASGTAAVLELGRRIAAHPAPRSVLLVHFDAEELGLVGSSVFVRRPPVPASAMVLMVNLDMVGRLRRGPLIIDVSAADRRLRDAADSVAHALGVRARATTSIAGRSDHASFREIGVPAVALFTGFHSDYHRATDVPSRIDLPGLLRVVDVAEGIVRAAASPAWPSPHHAAR